MDAVIADGGQDVVSLYALLQNRNAGINMKLYAEERFIT